MLIFRNNLQLLDKFWDRLEVDYKYRIIIEPDCSVILGLVGINGSIIYNIFGRNESLVGSQSMFFSCI